MRNNTQPEEYLSAAASVYYQHTWREIAGWLQKAHKQGRTLATFKKVTFAFTEEQLEMARRRGVTTDGNTRSTPSRTTDNSRGNVRWLNVSLSDDDAAFLTESDATLDQLAAMACTLVVRGYSLTVKPMDGGNSVMACIIGQSSTHPDAIVGLSGFSDNVRDALLVLCYKFEDKLGGELPLPDGDATTQGRRFR